jgi:ATP-dependent 26S proteasome regulatory subunit
VSRINVLVAATELDAKARVIAERVAARPDMQLVGEGVVEARHVEQTLAADPSLARVAIVLLGAPARTRPLAERWIATRRGLVVMLADLVDDVIRIEGVTLRDPRLDALLTALRQLVEQVRQESGTPTTASRRALLAKAVEWLDVVLLCALRSRLNHIESHPLAVTREPVARLLVARIEGRGGPVPDCECADPAAGGLTAALALADPDSEPLAALFRRLALTELEFLTIVLVLAAELDPVYQLVYGALHDDMGRRTPTLALVCDILGHPAEIREALLSSRGLTRWRLTNGGAVLSSADDPLRLDPSIAAWLLVGPAGRFDDPHCAALVRTRPWPGSTWLRQPDDLVDIAALEQQLTGRSGEGEWTVLVDGDVSIWRALVEAAAATSGSQITRVSVAAVAAAADPVDAVARLTRAIVLEHSVPVLDASEAADDGEQADYSHPLRALIDALGAYGLVGLIIVRGLERVVGAVPVSAHVRHRDRPGEGTLATAFAAAAADAGLYFEPSDTQALARSFPIALDAIEAAMRLAVLEGALEQAPPQQTATVFSACRRIASPSLPQFARRVRPVFTLDDIVLPLDRLAQLRELVANVTHAPQVLDAWGFGAQMPYGRGIAALFSGPSGTGKTMAAQAIAHALRTDAFVVDLSRVMSKYVGESEKNIDVAFRDAERAGAVLQIDEAESLFAKRTEAKDSHDRYANFLVSFLLHRMESFDGVAILTTNFGRTVDPAFLRRLRFVVEFPLPDAVAREAIWRRCLPADAPVAADVNLRFLARRFELSGGNIRSITLRAAFLAAGAGAAGIEMRHLVAATRAELLKLGMTAAERELADFAASLQQPGERVA